MLFAPKVRTYGAVSVKGEVGPEDKVVMEEDEDAMCGEGLSGWRSWVKAWSARGCAVTGVEGGASKALL